MITPVCLIFCARIMWAGMHVCIQFYGWNMHACMHECMRACIQSIHVSVSCIHTCIWYPCMHSIQPACFILPPMTSWFSGHMWQKPRCHMLSQVSHNMWDVTDVTGALMSPDVTGEMSPSPLVSRCHSLSHLRCRVRDVTDAMDVLTSQCKRWDVTDPTCVTMS